MKRIFTGTAAAMAAAAMTLAVGMASAASTQPDTKAAPAGPSTQDGTPMMGMYGSGMMPRGGSMPMMGPMRNGGMMMPTMVGAHGMMAGGMPMMLGVGGHVEGQIAYLKAELKITDAQESKWNAFADAVRANATKMGELSKQMAAVAQADATPSLPQRLDLQEKHMTVMLDSLRNLKAALTPLYTSFSDEQKRAADSMM